MCIPSSTSRDSSLSRRLCLIGTCAHHGCDHPVHCALEAHDDPAIFCSRHADSKRDELRDIDRCLVRAAKEAQTSHYQCAAPGCSNGLLADSQFYPVCSRTCQTMHNRLKGSSSLIDALPHPWAKFTSSRASSRLRGAPTKRERATGFALG
jgi:hypothetical protein